MSAPSKTRIAWVDNVKMVAMLFVILGHTWRLIHCPLPSMLNEIILSFNMALFVMMTGYTSVGAIGKIVDLRSLWDYVFKITKRILLPAALFYLAFFWLAGPLTMKKLLIAAAKILFVAGVAFVLCWHHMPSLGRDTGSFP
jgi:fucose 4-O-acetylase-like acetyltransferase